jgi:hypothetical protein
MWGVIVGRSDSPARDTAHHREDPLTHALPAGVGRPGLLMTAKSAALLRLEEVGPGPGAAASATAHVDKPLRRKALCE